MGKAIGIDLGTTNSCCAYVLNGKPQVVTYRDGSRTIPSVFAIDKQGNRLVGSEAQAQAAQNPNHTIAASKRLIGRSMGSSGVQKMQQVFTYELVEGESNEVLIKVADQVFTLEQISAAILRRIKESAASEFTIEHNKYLEEQKKLMDDNFKAELQNEEVKMKIQQSKK